MQDFSLDIVAKKSVKGIFALVSRTFILQILSIATSFVLTIFLEPSVFGVFFVVSSVIVFLNYLIGVADNSVGLGIIRVYGENFICCINRLLAVVVFIK